MALIAHKRAPEDETGRVLGLGRARDRLRRQLGDAQGVDVGDAVGQVVQFVEPIDVVPVVQRRVELAFLAEVLELLLQPIALLLHGLQAAAAVGDDDVAAADGAGKEDARDAGDQGDAAVIGIARRFRLAGLDEVNGQAAGFGAGEQQPCRASEAAAGAGRHVQSDGPSERVELVDRRLDQIAEPLPQFRAGAGDVEGADGRPARLPSVHHQVAADFAGQPRTDGHGAGQQRRQAAQHGELRPAFADDDDRIDPLRVFGDRGAGRRLAETGRHAERPRRQRRQFEAGRVAQGLVGIQDLAADDERLGLLLGAGRSPAVT